MSFTSSGYCVSSPLTPLPLLVGSLAPLHGGPQSVAAVWRVLPGTLGASVAGLRQAPASATLPSSRAWAWGLGTCPARDLQSELPVCWPVCRGGRGRREPFRGHGRGSVSLNCALVDVR